jgi:hypothetical protein
VVDLTVPEFSPRANTSNGKESAKKKRKANSTLLSRKNLFSAIVPPWLKIFNDRDCSSGGKS